MLTPAQLIARRSTLGSSEIGAVAGLNPYRGPFSVYIEKVPMTELSLEGEAQERFYAKQRTDQMQIGDVLEGAVADLYALRTGKKLRRCGTVVHHKHPWIAATPDRLIVNSTELLEIKVVGIYAMGDWGDGEDEVPADYRAQVEWQLEATGRTAANVAALMGTELRMYRIERDAELAAHLVEAGRRFWFGHVVPRVPPPMDATAGDYLRQRFPREATERPAPATPEADAIALEHMQAKERLKEATAAVDRTANQLKELIGDGVGLEQEGVWRATWKSTKSNGVDWEAVLEDLVVSVGVLAVEKPELAESLRRLTREDLPRFREERLRPGFRRFECKPVGTKAKRSKAA